jgi:hypothetical protein
LQYYAESDGEDRPLEPMFPELLAPDPLWVGLLPAPPDPEGTDRPLLLKESLEPDPLCDGSEPDDLALVGADRPLEPILGGLAFGIFLPGIVITSF